MAIYELKPDKLVKVSETSFSNENIKERVDLQRLLREQIEVISPNTLIIAEEFGEWEDSRRRVDLLGIDKDANLVVIELKRTDDGGHMELQAIRYAAMVSTLTFDKAVEIYSGFMTQLGIDGDPEAKLLEFLEWDEPEEDEFAQEVIIILASKEFSKELTTSVIWLNNQGLDIRCIRMKPYKDNEKILLDIQTVIPLPEAEDYQVKIREKQEKERQSRKVLRDTTRYEATIDGVIVSNLPKRGVMYQVVSSYVKSGVHPKQITDVINWRKNNLFMVYDGELDENEVYERLMAEDVGGKIPKNKRYFSKQDELLYVDGKTYVMSNQWGHRTLEAIEQLRLRFPKPKISVQPQDSSEPR